MPIKCIAGHEFDFFKSYQCQKLLPGGDQCPIHWQNIRWCTEADVNAKSVAHIDPVNIAEICEIMTEHEAQLNGINSAFGWVKKKEDELTLAFDIYGYPS